MWYVGFQICCDLTNLKQLLAGQIIKLIRYVFFWTKGLQTVGLTLVIICTGLYIVCTCIVVNVQNC